MRYLLIAFLSCISALVHAQKPKNGTYIYHIAFAEWPDQKPYMTVFVKIKGDSIYVIHREGGLSYTNPGDTLAKGIIMRHIRTGKWIIGRSPKDRKAEDVGGCTDGPPEIDFRRKLFWLC